MIRILIYRERSGIVKGFECHGHAGYSEYGTDIVCAAVSALVINTVNSIQTFTNDRCELSNDEKKGSIKLEFTGSPSEKSRLLVDSLELGIKNIEFDYGHEFVRLQIREV